MPTTGKFYISQEDIYSVLLPMSLGNVRQKYVLASKLIQMLRTMILSMHARLLEILTGQEIGVDNICLWHLTILLIGMFKSLVYYKNDLHKKRNGYKAMITLWNIKTYKEKSVNWF